MWKNSKILNPYFIFSKTLLKECKTEASIKLYFVGNFDVTTLPHFPHNIALGRYILVKGD